MIQIVTDHINSAFIISCIKIAALIVIGFPLVRMLANALARYVSNRINAHSGFIAHKIVLYGGISYIALSLLHELGFNVTALLGAAGVIGVALGFASQTSMSNLVAGIFLLLEQAFQIGDEISFEGTLGKVESIDLFSVKIRTTDNTLVRIPNELIIKKEMINLSYFAKRRLLFTLITPYQTDMKQLIDQVRTTFAEQSFVLAAPEIRVEEFLNEQCSLRIRAQVKNSDIVDIREKLLVAIRSTLEAKGLVVNELYVGAKPTSAESANIRIIK